MFKPATKGFFFLSWGSVILRNITSKGKLVTHRSLKQFKKKSLPMWLECKLHIFRTVQNSFFPVFRCCECHQMDHVANLKLDQDEGELDSVKCIHSKMADIVVTKNGPWNNQWPVDLDDIDVHEVNYNIELQYTEDFVTLREDDIFLAAIKRSDKDKTSILFTLNALTKTPYCNLCSKKPCKCFRMYKKKVSEVNPDADQFWQRRKVVKDLPKHYDADDEESQHFSYYGCNIEKLLYPIHRNEEVQTKFDAKLAKTLALPESFVPASGDSSVVCRHGNWFDPDNYVKITDSVTVYELQGESILPIAVYARKSLGNCKVRQY